EGTEPIYRTNSDHRSLPADEKQPASVLFYGRDQLWLHNENHTVISAGISALKAWLKLAEQKVYFFSNRRYLIPAIVFSVLIVGTVAYLRSPASLLAVAFVSLCFSIWSREGV